MHARNRRTGAAITGTLERIHRKATEEMTRRTRMNVKKQWRNTAWEVLGGLSFGAAVHGAIVFLTWMF